MGRGVIFVVFQSKPFLCIVLPVIYCFYLFEKWSAPASTVYQYFLVVFHLLGGFSFYDPQCLKSSKNSLQFLHANIFCIIHVLLF